MECAHAMRMVETIKGNAWGLGLMLIGAGIGALLNRLAGAILILLGFALIVWKETHKSRLSAGKDECPAFVLEIAGSQPLSSKLSDWKFLLTNCGTRTARYVQLSTIRSEIGAYEIWFKEIPVLLAGQKTAVDYGVVSRRRDDREKHRQGTLWDFALDNAGERGTTYFRYDISIKYTDTDGSVGDGGIMAVVFYLHDETLTTEGGQYRRETSD